MQTTIGFDLALDARARMTILSRYESAGAFEQLLAPGMKEGITRAIGQIDAILEAA